MKRELINLHENFHDSWVVCCVLWVEKQLNEGNSGAGYLITIGHMVGRATSFTVIDTLQNRFL